MRYIVLSLLVTMLAASPTIAGAPSQPANHSASPATRKVLAYITQLEGKQGRHVLTGQFLGYANQASASLPVAIHEKTGCWPALIGVDYADFDQKTLSPTKPNRTAIAYWQSGGLVTVSAHLYNPANSIDYGLRDRGVNLEDLLRPETETAQRWRAELDRIADGLAELRAAGVIVLWRPFHEMNGNWFWWGQQDPAAFVRVWRDMFDYFTRVKRLDNLLWVYAPNEGALTDAYYPGDAYVDLVGLDAYTNEVDLEHVSGYANTARLSKPWGFTEFGPKGWFGRPPRGNFDYRRFSTALEATFKRATFFLCWDERWSPANNPHLREFYRAGIMVNRDDLPRELHAGP